MRLATSSGPPLPAYSHGTSSSSAAAHPEYRPPHRFAFSTQYVRRKKYLEITRSTGRRITVPVRSRFAADARCGHTASSTAAALGEANIARRRPSAGVSSAALNAGSSGSELSCFAHSEQLV